MISQNLESQILEKELIQNNVGNFSTESLYMGFFEGSKILLLALKNYVLILMDYLT